MIVLSAVEAPPWFAGWIAIIPCLLFGLMFLYYGVRYSSEAHMEALKDERQPDFMRILPWWAIKLFLIILGAGILLFCILYFVHVPEEF